MGKAVHLRQEAEGTVGEWAIGNFAKLAEEHEVRANTYRQVASMLETPVGSIDMDLAEWDALSLVKVRDGCDAFQCRTNQGVDAITSMVFSGCASGVDHGRQRMRTACA